MTTARAGRYGHAMASAGSTRRPTMADVGRLAGVSATTVSFVLNPDSTESISPATRARVMQAVNDLGYVPNRAAQNLRRKSSGTLGIVVDETALESFAGVTVSGAHDAAWAAGAVVLVTHTGRRPGALAAIAEELVARQVDGLLVVASGTRALDLPPMPRGTPVVLLNCFSPEGAHPAILPDERAGGYAAARQLLDAGHRDIACLTGHSAAWATSLRVEGFRDAAREAGLDPQHATVHEGRYYVDSGQQLTARLLAGEHPPTGLVCGNDRMALGAYLAAASAGMRIPQDLSIVGYDDHEPVIQQVRPAMSTVRLPLYEIGRRGAQALLDGSWAGLPPVTALQCPAVERDSVAAPAPSAGRCGHGAGAARGDGGHRDIRAVSA